MPSCLRRTAMPSPEKPEPTIAMRWCGTVDTRKAYPGSVGSPMAALDPTSSALELAAALRRRELSAVELLDACLTAIDHSNPQLNAVIWRNDEDARAAAAE